MDLAWIPPPPVLTSSVFFVGLLETFVLSITPALSRLWKWGSVAHHLVLGKDLKEKCLIYIPSNIKTKCRSKWYLWWWFRGKSSSHTHISLRWNFQRWNNNGKFLPRRNVDLMKILLSFEFLLTNSLKYVGELTKEVKKMSFSVWILSLLYCLYLEVALRPNKAACVNARFDNTSHWGIESPFSAGLKIKPLRVANSHIFWMIWAFLIQGMGACPLMPHCNW